MAQQRHTHIPASSSELKEKFINCIMRCGKKTVARNILQDSLDIMRKKGKKEPDDIFEKGITNCKPQVEVRPKRVGGAVYQIPMEVKPKRQLSLSIRWILAACRKRKGKPLANKLADELIEAAQEQGAAFKKKQDVFRMAQANKAFAHFAHY